MSTLNPLTAVRFPPGLPCGALGPVMWFFPVPCSESPSAATDRAAREGLPLVRSCAGGATRDSYCRLESWVPEERKRGEEMRGDARGRRRFEESGRSDNH